MTPDEIKECEDRDRLKQRAEALVAMENYWTNADHQIEMRQIMNKLYGET